MKIRWKTRQGWPVRWVVCPLLVLVLTAGMAAVIPALNGMAAGFIDLKNPCSMKILPVDPGETYLAEDLAEADIVYDVYQIAEAVEVPGYDTYTYEFVSNEFGDYTGLEYNKDFTNEQWMQMAQKAAGLTLKTDGAPPVVAEGVTNAEVKNLPCGLYLVIARGRGIEDYFERVTDEEGNTTIVSIAYSDEHIYRFAPALVSLPGRQAAPGGSTSDTTPWVYDLTVTLKPEQGPRYGRLEIVKTLESYETRDPATFVFDVTATLPDRRDNGKVNVVYSNVVTITFTEPGGKSVLLEKKLPVGASVTVREVYSGAVYEQTSVDPDPVTIAADEIVQVEFSNEYNEEHKGGGSVNNHFTYDGDTWVPEQIYDDGRVVRGGQT